MGCCDKENEFTCKCKPLSRHQENGRNSDDRFFYKGKFFKNEQDFWNYTEDWPFMNTDQETFYREWDHLGKQIWLNVQIRESKLSNGALNDVLEESFIYFLQKFL